MSQVPPQPEPAQDFTPESTPGEGATRQQCRHIFTDGHRCGSPCLRGQDFCYYHHTSRRPTRDASKRRSRQSAFALPTPEDRSAIQHGIGEILRKLAGNQLDPKRAGLLLYGLQIASLNLPRPRPAATAAVGATPEASTTVDEIVEDPELGCVAPVTEYHAPGSRPEPGPAEQMVNAWLLD